MKLISKTLHSILLLSIYVFVLSCQKQSSPDIFQEEAKGAREIERLDACSKVNFNKGVLLYKNTIDLFICTKWNEEFPDMFQSLKTISAESWDHLMAPVDQVFIEDQQRRDRVFKNIRELDSKGGLDDLSYVITALNETNFFDTTKALFSCIENPLDIQCLTRVGRIPEKKSLKNIIKLIDVNPATIDNASFFLKVLVKALYGQQENLRAEINKVRASPIYIPSRLSFVDALAAKVLTGFSEEDRGFLSKILLTGNGNGEVPWIYQWLQDVEMNREKFRDLVEYPVLVNPEFIGEIKGLEKVYDSGLSCTIKSTTSPNELIEFVFKTHLSDFVGVIRDQSYKSFYDYSSAGILGLKMSTEVCRELEANQYNINLIKVHIHLAEFLSEKKFYDLTKFLITQSTATGDPDKTFAENMYLYDIFTGDIFTSLNTLNSNIVSSTRGFYPVVFDVIKSLPPEGYTAIGEVAQAVLQPENDIKLRGLVDFWRFLTAEEKNFVFRFLDRHFDKDTNYVLLFDFYTKFLDETREVQPIFKDKWMGTDYKEEMSYLALQDMFSKMAGRETLSDFKKFFSRDHILKVLEIISNGKNINKLAREELRYIYSDTYIARNRTEKYVFKVKYDSAAASSYDSKAVLECMQKFSDIQNGFYELVRHLPAACTKITDENIAFRLYGWMNAIEESYLSFKKATNSSDSLLDKNGIFSPYMLNNAIGLSKVVDNLVGPFGSPLPSKNGLNYLLNSANYYLNQKSAAPLIDKNINWINSFLDISADKNTQHRNALIKSFTREDNFSYSRNTFNNIGKLFLEYGEWIKSGGLAQAQQRSLGIYDPKYDCLNVINQFISPNPCPSKTIVKKYGNDMLYLFQNIFEKENGSPVAMLMKAAKKGEGLAIPLNGKNQRKVRISLRDTFRYMYDTSDRSFKVNNLEVNFVNEYGKSSREKVTTLERVESVIREVRFGNNYLGVSFLNAIVHGDDYNSDVESRKKLLKKCIKIPGIRCGRKMSDSDLRMAKNSLEVYDALSDVNNGRGLDSRLNFGDYLKTFEQALVASSATEAQKTKLLPLKDEVLVKHNGKILADMTIMNTWSNLARIIRDRVGRSRSQFDDFINSEEFKRVDGALLYGFNLPAASSSAERLLKKLSLVPANEKQNLFGNTVDWIADLNYEETRLLEDTLARLMVVGSYLGTPEVVFSKEANDTVISRYKDNNLFQIFLALEKIIDYWPTLKNYFPANSKLIDVIKPINTGLYFLTNKLNSTSDPQKNTAYMALNDLFLVLQTTLFENVKNPHVAGSAFDTTNGLDLILELLKNPAQVESTYGIVREDYQYLDVLHQNNGQWFSSVGQNLVRLTLSPKVDLTPVQDFLSFTTKNSVCRLGDANCADNYHYDEPASLIKFLNAKSNSGQSNFMLLNKKVFLENLHQISQMIDYLIPAVAIKEVRPPLRLN